METSVLPEAEMIELRWLVIEEGRAPVLQFRVKDNWGAHNEEPDWGEWQDVPTLVLWRPR